MVQWSERSPLTNVAQVESWTWHHKWAKGFVSGISSFPPSTKTNTSKFQFDLETTDEESPWDVPLQIPICLLFHLFTSGNVFLSHHWGLEIGHVTLAQGVVFVAYATTDPFTPTPIFINFCTVIVINPLDFRA